MVKFARFIPPPDDIAAALGAASRFLDKTHRASDDTDSTYPAGRRRSRPCLISSFATRCFSARAGPPAGLRAGRKAAVGHHRLHAFALRRAPRSVRARLSRLPALLLAASTVLFAIALAGPRTRDTTSHVSREGIAIVMAVDRSGSMNARDFGRR